MSNHQFVDLAREVPLVLVPNFFEHPLSFYSEDLLHGPAGYGKYYTRDGISSAGLLFFCPGCFEANSIAFEKFDNHDSWTWNGNREKPSCTPSIFSTPEKGGCGWHGFLTNGIFNLKGYSGA